MHPNELLHSGEIYDPSESAIMTEQTACLEKQYDFNATRPSEGARRTQLLKEMFAEIGENCYIEPPLHANLPGHMGKNCGVGAGVIVLPGVHIGDDTVIGAGSVVTKDIPSGVVAVGNPCRLLRKISAHDRAFYYKDRAVPKELLDSQPVRYDRARACRVKGHRFCGCRGYARLGKAVVAVRHSRRFRQLS